MVDPYAGPEPKGVAASLAHRWGLPMFSLGAGGDPKVVDEQSAAEAGMTMLADALAGGHLIHDCGYLESAPHGLARPARDLRRARRLDQRPGPPR